MAKFSQSTSGQSSQSADDTYQRHLHNLLVNPTFSDLRSEWTREWKERWPDIPVPSAFEPTEDVDAEGSDEDDEYSPLRSRLKHDVIFRARVRKLQRLLSTPQSAIEHAGELQHLLREVQPDIPADHDFSEIMALLRGKSKFLSAFERKRRRDKFEDHKSALEEEVSRTRRHKAEFDRLSSIWKTAKTATLQAEAEVKLLERQLADAKRRLQVCRDKEDSVYKSFDEQHRLGVSSGQNAKRLLEEVKADRLALSMQKEDEILLGGLDGASRLASRFLQEHLRLLPFQPDKQ